MWFPHAAWPIIYLVEEKPNRLVHIHQEHQHMVYTTWLAMFGSGVRIGIHQLIIPVLRRAILQDLPAALTASFAAAAGTTPGNPFVPLIVTFTIPPSI